VTIWLAALGLAAGTAAGLGSPSPRLGFVLVVTGCAALAFRRSAALMLVGLVVAAGGAGLVNGGRVMPPPGPLSALAAEVEICEVAGRITEQAGGLGTLVALDAAACDHAVLQGPLGSAVCDCARAEPGARMRGEVRFVPLGKSSFGSARRRLGAQAEMVLRQVSFSGPQGPFMVSAAAVRQGLRDATSPLGAERGALLRGLTIGDTEGLTPATEQNLQRAGLTHLVAVSGSNVAIVLGAITYLARPLGHAGRIVAAAVALILFVLVVGPEPSVLRAAAMGAIGLIALASGRTTEPLCILGLALIAVLALRPGMIVSVGLQLSVAATAGLVLWGRPLASLMSPGPDGPRLLALGLGATLAAQLAVAPLLIIVFGELSIAGPLANLAAMPAVAPSTILGFGAAATSLVMAPLGEVLARLAEPFAGWILLVGDSLGAPGWASLQVPAWLGWAGALPALLMALRSARLPAEVPVSP
jgi:competence protein ComEC